MRTIKVLFSLAVLLALAVPALANEPIGNESFGDDQIVAAQAGDCVTVGAYEVCFLGVDYSDTNSTWTYSVTHLPDVDFGQALSHWVLATCEQPTSSGTYSTIASYGDVTGNSGVNYPTSWGQDNKTFGAGVDVFKYDESNLSGGSTEIFQFTMGDLYGQGSIDIATKSGRNTGVDFASITGPDCNNTVTPEEPTPTPTPEGPTTAVTLRSFVVATEGNTVLIDWRTGTEMNSVGFNLYRAGEDGNFVKINDSIIPATGSEIAGGSYNFTDTPGTGEYVYFLEEVDYSTVTTQYNEVQVQILETLRTPNYRPIAPR
jgi:hypothetical protein